jgi:hypothetical protein
MLVVMADYYIWSASFSYPVYDVHRSLNIFLFFCSDGETFISADDLRINLWNLEISSQSFNIVDVKPANMEDLTGRTHGILSGNYMIWWIFYHF